MQFTEKEMALLRRIIWAAVQDANSAQPVAANITGSEYKTLCAIANKTGRPA